MLLSQPRWEPALARVRWVIVDEIHALAESKHGSHLSLSMERLEELARRSGAGSSLAGARKGLQRVGLSATVAPLSDVASHEFIASGAGNEVTIRRNREEYNKSWRSCAMSSRWRWL